MIAALTRARKHMAEKTVDSISMFRTPKSWILLKKSFCSFSVNEQNAPSSRAWAKQKIIWINDFI